MNFDLGEEHELVRRTVRDFAEQRIAPVAEELDREERFPYDIVAELAELGLMGMPIPEEYGGAGADTLSYAIAIEELTRVDSSVAITVAAHTSLGTAPIYLFGNDDQKARWLPDLCSGRRLGAFGLTEPEAGSDAGNTRTRAIEQPDGSFVVDGEKMFITNAGTPISGLVTITALTGEGEISTLVVENGTEGFEPGPPLKKMGWRASDTRALHFKACRVPAENLLGPRGRGLAHLLEVLDGGRISVAALGLGLAQGAYEQALAYARERRAFGQAIARFQAIQFKLADMATKVEAARLLMLKAARMKDAGERSDVEAGMAKLFASEAGKEVVEDSFRIHGGYGYSKEYEIERLYREVAFMLIGEGTTDIQKQIIGRKMLEEYRLKG